MRIPLLLKILAWFFLNIALVVLVGWLLLREQFRFSAIPARGAGEQVVVVANALLDEVVSLDLWEWEKVLAKFSEQHGVEFRLYSGDGRHLAGARDALPPEVHGRIFGPPRPGDARRPGVVLRDGPPPRENLRRDLPPRRPPLFEEQEDFPEPRPPRDLVREPVIAPGDRLMVQTANPNRYWMVVRVARQHPELRRGAIVAAVSESPTGNGFFFDPRPYWWGAAGVLLLSALIWVPFVRGLTRSVSRMRDATAQLAEGNLEARVEELRRDEVGELGASINGMARRLAGYVHGQRRFLGDVAHELSAPIARLQMAVSILEQRASEADRGRLGDVKEEVEHMAGLVNELLQFSRATLGAKPVLPVPVDLAAMVARAVHREAGDVDSVRVEIPPGLAALGDADLLQRAVANLLRNSIRYAGHAGPITVQARVEGGAVLLAVLDEGPGIPAEALPKIFDPFYRLDEARTHGTGGVGLGLAIVKTCIEACGGKVEARNREPRGLEVRMALPLASVGE